MRTLIRRPGTNAVLSYEPITDSVWLFGDLWTPVRSLPDAVISAQISRDHPGMLVQLRRDISEADLLRRFDLHLGCDKNQ